VRRYNGAFFTPVNDRNSLVANTISKKPVNAEVINDLKAQIASLQEELRILKDPQRRLEFADYWHQLQIGLAVDSKERPEFFQDVSNAAKVGLENCKPVVKEIGNAYNTWRDKLTSA